MAAARKVGFIFKRLLDGVTVYWEGLVDDGRLLTSIHKCEAYVFASKDSALQCADTHDELRDSEVWKVVPR